MKFAPVLKQKLIYVMRINYEDHKGCLKVGETSVEENLPLETAPCCKELNKAAKLRINQYTQTAGIPYDLLYTELSVYKKDGEIKAISDKDVHDVLSRSGVERKIFDIENNANEWFITDLETVKRAIAAAKEGRKSLLPGYNRQNEKYTYLKRKVHFLHNSLMKNLSDSLSDHRF